MSARDAMARKVSAWHPTPRQVAIVIAFLAVFAISVRVSVDGDTWWHLLAGRWMIEHHRVLTRDTFSWTRAGAPWTDHSWLSEIGLFLVWARWGFAGLNLATATLAVVTWGIVYIQSRGSLYLRASVVVLAAWASAFYAVARPELVSLVLFSTFAYVLDLFRWRGINRLWVLPPVMCAWVNLHGGFVAGFLLLGLTLAGQAASWILGQRGPGVVKPPDMIRLIIITLACAAATLVTPYGVDALLEPLRTLSIPFLHTFITEWQSPDFHVADTHGFVALLLVTIAALGLSRRRIDVTDLLLVSACMVLALDALRHIPLFAVITVPVIVRHGSAAVERGRRACLRLAPAAGGVVKPVVLWAVLTTCTVAAFTYVAPFLSPAVNVERIARTLPLGAVQYIRSTRPPGRMFNSYRWGGYLAWALQPVYRVYVDGRTDLYGGQFLETYVHIWTGAPEWRTIFRQEGIRVVVIARDAPLAFQLRNEPGWREGYSDGLASVFVATGPDTAGRGP